MLASSVKSLACFFLLEKMLMMLMNDLFRRLFMSPLGKVQQELFGVCSFYLTLWNLVSIADPAIKPFHHNIVQKSSKLIRRQIKTLESKSQYQKFPKSKIL